MVTTLSHLVIDANDPSGLARFWSAATGRPIVADTPDEVVVESPDDDPSGLALVFVPGAVSKRRLDRLHLDLSSSSTVEQRSIVERLVGLGATPLDIGQGEVAWTVLADPEGNEFCVLEPREDYAGTGSVAAVVITTERPAELADFWAAATGWSPVTRKPAFASLRAATGDGPFIEFLRGERPKTTKNRLHLDVAPEAGDDHSVAVGELLALGARRIDIGQGDVPWAVLADPDGNEFCVLTPR